MKDKIGFWRWLYHGPSRVYKSLIENKETIGWGIGISLLLVSTGISIVLDFAFFTQGVTLEWMISASVSTVLTVLAWLYGFYKLEEGDC